MNSKFTMYSLFIGVLICLSLISSSCVNRQSIKDTNYFKYIRIVNISINEIKEAAISMNEKEQISNDAYNKFVSLYNKVKKSNDVVLDSIGMALELGLDPTYTADFNSAMESFKDTLKDLLDLSFELGITDKILEVNPSFSLSKIYPQKENSIIILEGDK